MQPQINASFSDSLLAEHRLESLRFEVVTLANFFHPLDFSTAPTSPRFFILLSFLPGSLGILCIITYHTAESYLALHPFDPKIALTQADDHNQIFAPPLFKIHQENQT